MVIDSSAILAILQDEPERQSFNQTIAAASERHLSAASLVEIAIVVEARFGAQGQRNLDLFLATAAIDVVPFDRQQAELARMGLPEEQAVEIWPACGDPQRIDQATSVSAGDACPELILDLAEIWAG